MSNLTFLTIWLQIPVFLVNEKKDLENDGPPINPNLPFPKSIFLIVGNEFCERFSYYGMRSNSKF